MRSLAIYPLTEARIKAMDPGGDLAFPCGSAYIPAEMKTTHNSRLLCQGRNISLCLLVFALAGGCSRSLPPQAVPPRILSYAPVQEDTLRITQSQTLRFVMLGQGSEEIEYDVRLDGELVARAQAFQFVPLDHGFYWPEIRQNRMVRIDMTLRDGAVALSRTWWVEVRVTPGVEFIVSPVETDLVTPAGVPIAFHMEVQNANATINFLYRLDGTNVQIGSDYYFDATELGTFTVEGHAYWSGNDIWYEWDVDVIAGEDQDPPPAVSDLISGPGPMPGTLALAFTRPAGANDILRYEIRGFIRPDSDDWSSTYLVGVIDPNPIGPNERTVITNQAPGKLFYTRVKAYDRSGHASAWGNMATGLVAGYTVAGRLIDYDTGQPLEGFGVRYGEVESVSGSDGSFRCAQVEYLLSSESDPPGELSDEQGPALGDWFDVHDSRAVDDSLVYRLGSFRTEPFYSPENDYSDFLSYFLQMSRAGYWSDRLVRPHYPVHLLIPEYENGGIDYRQRSLAAVQLWEDAVGLDDLFDVVLDPEDADVFFRFIPDTTNFTGSYQVLSREQGTRAPLKAIIHMNGSYGEPFGDGAQRILLHELGHALGPLEHSNDDAHVMATTNVQDAVSPDEARLIRILYHMRPGEELGFLVSEYSGNLSESGRASAFRAERRRG